MSFRTIAMAILQKIADTLDSGAGAVGSLFERLGSIVAGLGDPTARRQVAFSVALIALSAKMAKADGIVMTDEVAAFRNLFTVSASEQKNVDRLFDLASRDVAGYEAYAARIVTYYGGDRQGLEDVVDGLFAIARADGAIHAEELSYLENVATIFGIDGTGFERISARHMLGGEGDPYLILGVERTMAMPEIRRHYVQLVSENHPDRMMARGLPPEAIAIANGRVAAINRAYERIEAEKRG
jgi:DnaJ like chaperone protein